MSYSVPQMKRNVKDSWYVKYEEGQFPSIQKGWVLPVERWAEFDPFILMAEDWFKRGTFSDHPHRGFQTLTYVIGGRLEHIDNGGGRGILEPGDLQYMNAGWAARHAEEGVDEDIAHTLQLWVNLPKHLKKSETFYQNVYAEDAPQFNVEGGSVKVFAGKVGQIEGPLKSLIPISVSEISLENGAIYSHPLPAAHNAFIYMLSGDIEIGEEKVNLKKHGVASLTFDENGSDEKMSEVRIKSKHRRSKLLVYSGAPINEDIVPYGPFVMNTMEEIQEAFQDYQKGKFGRPAK
jgi:quercetin 2,3-dioxygenase